MFVNNIHPHALVIGAGVSGLTTAICLVRQGFKCTIIADKGSPNITSNVAGALWEWPPAVCGYHHDEISLDRSKSWCMTSYRKFDELKNEAWSGVSVRPVTFYFRNRIEDNAFHLNKMHEIRDHVPGFERGRHLLERPDINQDIGLIDAYSHSAPMIDTDRYLGWLETYRRTLRIPIIQKKLEGSLKENEAALLSQYAADAIFNCCGLGARELAPEYMYPLRGAVVRLVNDGRRFPKLTEAHCVSHDNTTSEDEIVFIVPRGDNRIVLGAIAEKDKWETNIDFENYEPIRRMFDRCVEFLPMLKDAEIDPDEHVRSGLRPFRPGNVRVQHETGTNIFHNYGHGGAGVTLSWGCAEEIASMAAKFLISTQEHQQSKRLATA